MSVYDMPGRMSALMQNAYGIANYGIFPVGGNVPQQYTQSVINGVGGSIAGMLDYSSSMGQQPVNFSGMGFMQPSMMQPSMGMMGMTAGVPGMQTGLASNAGAFNPFQSPAPTGGLLAGGLSSGAGSGDVMNMMTQLLQIMSMLISKKKLPG